MLQNFHCQGFCFNVNENVLFCFVVVIVEIEFILVPSRLLFTFILQTKLFVSQISSYFYEQSNHCSQNVENVKFPFTGPKQKLIKFSEATKMLFSSFFWEKINKFMWKNLPFNLAKQGDTRTSFGSQELFQIKI